MIDSDQRLRDELDDLAASGVLGDSIDCALEQIEEVMAYALHHQGWEPTEHDLLVGAHPLQLAPDGPLPGGEWDERSALEYVQQRLHWIRAARAVASRPTPPPVNDAAAVGSGRRRLWRVPGRHNLRNAGPTPQIPIGMTRSGTVWSAPWNPWPKRVQASSGTAAAGGRQ